MAKNGSKNSSVDGNENQFDNPSNPVSIPPSRTPLNAIPDPSQFHKEFLQELVHQDKNEAGSNNRRKSDSVHSTPARSVSRTTYVGQLGACTGPRASQVPGERGGNISRVSREISVVNCELPPTDVRHFELVEDPSFWNDHNVQVLIRMRPLSNMEKMSFGYGQCLRQESLQTLAWLGHPEIRFTFDHIACETISQEKLFRVSGLPMVDNCMSGYNSCIFAYGQTGSGKTYTMMGEISQREGKLIDDCGITPRLFEYLFTRIELEEENRREERLKYSCKCSFLEIYNEQITDLLEPSSTNLQLREDLKKGVYVEDLTEYNVRTVDEVLKLLLKGAANRKVAGTDMNSESSRSHSVFTCIVESRWEKDSMTHLRFARLNLVDLAGSERQKSYGAGERLKEASYINKSLSTLGLVIMSLVDVAHGKHRHVPYRDSRLTFLLQDSLGGNSKTTIIANVSPSIGAANETLSTLKFAQRAKLIQNNAKVNEDASGDVTALQRQIQLLKEQMSLLMKHQKVSRPLFQFRPTLQPSLVDIFKGEDSSGEENIYVDSTSSVLDGQKRKAISLNAASLGDFNRENLAGNDIRTLQAQIEHKNHIALQREDVQRTKMMLRFREEKIKRLELLANGVVSTDKYLIDENNALMEEIHQLRARIYRNSEMTSFQNPYEQGERETLLAEVSTLHDQLLKTLEVEEHYVKRNFPTQRENEDENAEMDLEEYKQANSKLIRKVDELQSELSKYMDYSQAAVYPVQTVLPNIDLVYDKEACDQVEDGVLNNGGQETGSEFHSGNISKELIDPRILLEAMESRQARLVEELQCVRQENERLVNNKEERQSMLNLERSLLENQNVPSVTEGDRTACNMTDLQVKLDNMTKDLEEARLLNDSYLEDHVMHSSHQHQVDLVHKEADMETTKAILHLQEELASLQVKYHRRLCTMSEENKKLRSIIAAKEDEMYTLHTDWESASLELTRFLSDGSKSIRDASEQIEGIAFSFPRKNVLVGEHVKKAAYVWIEKEQTILQLEKNLVDAQNTIMQMQEKLNSLRSATIALTEIQCIGTDARAKDTVQLSTMLDNKTSMVYFHENKFICQEDQEKDAKTNFYEAEGLCDHPNILQTDFVQDDMARTTLGMSSTTESKQGPRTGTFENYSASEDIENQVEMARQGLMETENAFNMSQVDAEIYLSTFQTEIHDAFSLYKDLVQDLLKEICEMRKNLVEFKENKKMVEVQIAETPPEEVCTHQMQENQFLMLQQIINELATTNNRLHTVKSYIKSVIGSHEFQVRFEDVDGWMTDISTPSSILSDDDDDASENKMVGCSYKSCRASPSGISEQTSALLFEDGSKYSSSNQESKKQNGDVISWGVDRKAHLFLKKQFDMAYEAFMALGVQLATLFKEKDTQVGAGFWKSLERVKTDEQNTSKDRLKQLLEPETSIGQPTNLVTQENAALYFKATKLVAEEKACQANSFFSKFEEARATMNEADYMLNELIKANEAAKKLTSTWKQAGEELIVEKASLIEEIAQLKKTMKLKDEEHAILETQSRCSLLELENLVSLLEASFQHMQRDADEFCRIIYSDALATAQGILQCVCISRSSLQDVCAETMEKSFASFVMQQCHIRGHFNKFRRLDIDYGPQPSRLYKDVIAHDEALWIRHNNSMINFVDAEQNHSIYAARKEMGELGAACDCPVNENLKLKKALEHEEILLQGFSFDCSLLQESVSTRKDIKDEAEKLTIVLSQVQHDLKMKTNQLDDMLVEYKKLEGRLTNTEAALCASNSDLEHAKETVDALSYQNAEFRSLLEDLRLEKAETEELLKEQREIVNSLEKEIHCTASSAHEQLVCSLEGTRDDLRRISDERDQLRVQIESLQDRLDMAYAIADENEAIAVEARQESEASKLYAEQKEEEIKILEKSIEELECTINVLEKKVYEMEEEVERHRMIRDSLELELQALNQRLLTVENFRDEGDFDIFKVNHFEDQISRRLELHEAHKRIKALEDERAEQAKEIKQCKDYISELVLHAEAQASQYQQKYKTLEAMVSAVKNDSSNSGSEAPLSNKAEKSSVRTRGSSSPFRCIGNLVQQMNIEKDQELSLTKLRIEELDALASSRQKEVCMLRTKLAAAESMTHDVIRDLLGVKLDMTNYANLIDQYQLQKLVEDAHQQTQEFRAMEQEILSLKHKINELLEERDRCISEVHSKEAVILASQMTVAQLQERDQLLTAQNEMLKADKTNLQRRAAELDDMIKKLLGKQPIQPQSQQQENPLSKPCNTDFGKRLANSEKLLLRVNDELARYRRSDSPLLHKKLDGRGTEKRLR